MTTKEKANDLVDKFSECGEDNEMYIETAKKCALLHVEEMLSDSTVQNIGSPESGDMRESWRTYFNEIKEEIKLIKFEYPER